MALAECERVHINVRDLVHAAQIKELFAGRVEPESSCSCPLDAWCQDHPPIIVDDDAGDRAALDFRYNAWGDK